MNLSIRNIILAKDICSVISFLDNTFLCLKVYPSTFFVERLTRVLYRSIFQNLHTCICFVNSYKSFNVWMLLSKH